MGAEKSGCGNSRLHVQIPNCLAYLLQQQIKRFFVGLFVSCDTERSKNFGENYIKFNEVFNKNIIENHVWHTRFNIYVIQIWQLQKWENRMWAQESESPTRIFQREKQ